MVLYQGERLAIVLTDEAISARADAEEGQDKACIAQLLRLMKRLADTGLRSPDQFHNQGDKIYAIKARCGLRAYGWFSERRPSTFVIGHFSLKKKQKLDRADLKQAINARAKYEGI